MFVRKALKLNVNMRLLGEIGILFGHNNKKSIKFACDDNWTDKRRLGGNIFMSTIQHW